jgi:MFS transporter, SHS family, lactate transporter
MTMTAEIPGQVPSWKEPTKDQWMAWIAAWLGWTLDAFDFTIFLLIMVPIAESFHVPLIEVTAVFTITLWLRLVGAVGSGWLADRVGRKTPLMTIYASRRLIRNTRKACPRRSSCAIS